MLKEKIGNKSAGAYKKVRNNITIDDCLETAYNDIKDRKGKMVDGVFVKQWK